MYKNKINFLLNEIIRQRPDLSEDRVISLAQRKKEEIKGISDYTALLLVAIDLGVKLSVKQSFITPIGKLVDSLNSVNVKGRILWVGQEKKFKRRDGTTGMFVRAGIGDSTGVCSVIFWDRPRRELEELGVVEGNVVEISYASTRKSLSGEVELHVGLKSEIMDRSDEIDQYPPTADFLKPLSEIMSASGRIYTLGQVINEPVKTKFKIEGEDEERSLLWFNITDGKKVVRVVVWNPNQNYEWVKPGTTVAIFNAKPKIGLNGEIELHVGKVSHISPFSGKEYEIKFKPSILKDLKQGYNMAKIYVRINAIGKLKIFEAKRKSISIHASDISSDVNITFIGKIAEKIVGLKPGDVISIAGFRVRLRRGEIFIFCDDFTELDINPEVPSEFIPPPANANFVNLSDISIFHKVVNIQGNIVKEPKEEIIQPLQIKKGEFYIEQSGIPAKISYNGTIMDYSAEKLEVGELIKIYGAYVDPTSFLIEAPYISLKLRAFSRIEKVT